MNETFKDNLAQFSTYFNLRIAFIVASVSVVVGFFAYCYIFQIALNELNCVGVNFLLPVLFAKIYALYFMCAKTIDENWEYKPSTEILNSQYRDSPYEDKVDQVTLHDLYETITTPFRLIFVLCIVTGFPYAKIANIPVFFQTFICPIMLTSLGALLVKAFYLKKRSNIFKSFLDLAVLSTIYWALCGDIYCSFHLKPHYPLWVPDLGYLGFGLAGMPVIAGLFIGARRYSSPDLSTTLKGRAYFISAVISVLFILAAPHQFNNLMYYTYTGGGRPILIKESDKAVEAAHILDRYDYFIAWPKDAPSPLTYPRSHFKFNYLEKPRNN